MITGVYPQTRLRPMFSLSGDQVIRKCGMLELCEGTEWGQKSSAGDSRSSLWSQGERLERCQAGREGAADCGGAHTPRRAVLTAGDVYSW